MCNASLTADFFLPLCAVEYAAAEHMLIACLRFLGLMLPILPLFLYDKIHSLMLELIVDFDDPDLRGMTSPSYTGSIETYPFAPVPATTTTQPTLNASGLHGVYTALQTLVNVASAI